MFALPSDTDEIVMVDDTPPMLLEAAAAQPPLPVEPEPTVTVATVIRTAYRQPVSLRTGKEKAAQPGFMCPDCAPVRHEMVSFRFVMRIGRTFGTP